MSGSRSSSHRLVAHGKMSCPQNDSGGGGGDACQPTPVKLRNRAAVACTKNILVNLRSSAEQLNISLPTMSPRHKGD